MNLNLVAATLVYRTVHTPIETAIMVTQHPSLPYFISRLLSYTALSDSVLQKIKQLLLNYSLVNTLDAGAMVKRFLIPKLSFHILH